METIGYHVYFHSLSSDEYGDLIRFVPVAAIQDGDRTAQAEFGDQVHAFLPCRMGGIEHDQFAGFEGGENIHARRIVFFAKDKQPPPGYLAGVRWGYWIWGKIEVDAYFWRSHSLKSQAANNVRSSVRLVTWNLRNALSKRSLTVSGEMLKRAAA